ncbi:hypothetical protein [Hyalangium rubrum]|uniref:Lysozyme inhibitor LprI N-terminal domain-containing protein n=1 Tax=Hyalangium rubrum TaxID=3103134 RepID=A0ABU5H739_9BACT|nr:hypothetical protein [Hyalangium sp. s54d21]MDY7227905.1 hypothetical protein [Hyalangium sp. s54d21]
MSDADPRKDPRFRPFRAAAYGVHIALSTVFCLWLTWNVGHSVAAMTPERQPPAEQVLSFRECLEGAQSLWMELETKRETLVRTVPASNADQEWMSFRTQWLSRLRERESQCALGSRERAELRAVFVRLDQVQDHYTIHAVQYALEVGRAVDALQDAFVTARKNPAAGRLP